MANLGPTNIEGNLVIKNQTYTPNMSSGGTSSRVVVLDDDGILRYKTNLADVNHNHDSTYLGISAQASDSAKLGGQLPSYYEPAFSKNTAFNKNFGTGNSDVATGDHSHSELHSHSNKAILDSISEAFTTALKANYDSAYTNSHTHSNKTVLDALTQAIIDNSHTHGNKTTLDAITAAFTTTLKTSYDGAVTNSHTHANKTVLDGLTQAVIDNSHTHSNKAILDAISASFTTALKTSYDSAVTNSHTHSNTTALNNVSGTNTGDETTTRIGTLINSATAKATPVDTDMVGLMDSAASNVLKKLSWANIKATFATAAQGTKADNALPSSSYTANDVLSKILTVDGPSSGLDADLLDGKHASEFATSSHNHDTAYLGLTAKATDSNKLDGKDSTDFSLVGHTHDYSASDHDHDTDYLGITATAVNSDKLDGKDSTDFSLVGHGHGNITNAGAIGTTSGLMVKTTTSGVLTTLPAGSSGQFLQYDGT